LFGAPEALRLLGDEPASRAWIDQAFSPGIPIRLPGFYPNPLVTTEQGSVGHIDVAFVVDTHGKNRGVRILETTRNAENHLKHVIKRSRFRSWLVDGQFADTDAIVVRYYLHE
jgi:hypothetical protein